MCATARSVHARQISMRLWPTRQLRSSTRPCKRACVSLLNVAISLQWAADSLARSGTPRANWEIVRTSELYNNIKNFLNMPIFKMFYVCINKFLTKIILQTKIYILWPKSNNYAITELFVKFMIKKILKLSDLRRIWCPFNHKNLINPLQLFSNR